MKYFLIPDAEVDNKKQKYKAEIILFIAFVLSVPSIMRAQSSFTNGNLVVERVGNGSTTLSSAAAPISFIEYTTGGSLAQTINAFTVNSGVGLTNRATVESGTASSAGHLTLSEDGTTLVFVGYDTTVAATGVISQAGTNVNRVVGFINSSGIVSTPTWFPNKPTAGAYKTNNFRAAYYDGTGIWTSGNDGNCTEISGIRYTTVTNGTSSVAGTPIDSSTNKNSAGIYVFKNQLYVTSTTGGSPGLYSVGSGKPTTRAQSLSSVVPYSAAVYDAVMLNVANVNPGSPDLLYATDGFYIYKYYYNGSSWTSAGKHLVDAFGLTANMNSSGTIDLYAVLNNGTSNNTIVKYTDGAAYNATLNFTGTPDSTIIASAGSNYEFLGITWAPTQSSTVATYSYSPANGTTISSGNYHDIIIASGVTATLGGNISVEGTITVQSGGTLICGTNVISSQPGTYGTFNLQSGATIQIGNTSGITSYAASGNIQTFSRFYSTGANYVYNGISAQVTGNALPSTVNTLTINNTAGVTLSGNLTATNGITMTNGSLSNGGNSLTNSATLSYNGTSVQTVGTEWTNSMSNNVSITNTNGVILGGNITGYTGTINVGSGANFNLGTNTINGSGNITFSSGSILTTANSNGVGSSNNAGIQLSGTVTYSPTMSFVLNGGSAQHTGTDMPASVSNFTLINSHGAILDAALTITGTCTLTSGIITLGSYKLTIGSSGQISGAGSSNYILTNSTGVLEMQANTSGVMFPIGDDYNPIKIKTTSGTAVFDVSVSNGITDATNTSSYSNDVVNRTWVINITTGSATINVTPQWNDPSDITGSFDENKVLVASRTSLTSAWNSTKSSTSATSLGGSDYNILSGNISVSSGNTAYIGVGSGIIGTNPLPVDLIQFTAQPDNGEVTLRWTTASEQNNSHFIVERSLNAQNWSPIGRVEGHGTTQVKNDYSYIDPLTGFISNGNIYYRLKQVDFNARFNYSNINEVQLTGFQNTLYPNPATSVINIALQSDENADAAINILDLDGKLVQSSQLSLLEGNNSLKIDVSKMPTGNYIIRISTSNFVKNYRISKVE